VFRPRGAHLLVARKFATRPDGSFGFEEFRRDAEDAGAWTPVSYYSGLRHASKGEASAEAARRVAWLALRHC